MELEVLKKARELGETLQNCETFVELSEAQAEMEADEECLDLLMQMNEMEQDLQMLIQTEGPDSESVQKKTEEYRAARTQAEDHMKILRYQGAAQSFQQMMNQVNQIIQFFLTGDDGNGCGGNCEGCSGCGE